MFMRTMKNYLKKEDTVKSQDIFIDFSKKKKKLGGGKILEKLRMSYLLFTPSITLPINSAYIRLKKRKRELRLKLVEKGLEGVKEDVQVPLQNNFELARKIAEESAVLLKNEDNILPVLEKESTAFIGFTLATSSII